MRVLVKFSLLPHCTSESKMGGQQLCGSTRDDLARVLGLATGAQTCKG